MKADAQLYLVAPARLDAAPLVELVDELVDAGVDLIQLREKDIEAGELLRLGAPLLESCRGAGVPLIINDRPDVALALGADGVHVGQNDLPPSFVRSLVKEGIVGWSTHTPAQVDAAVAEASIDYFAVGPVHETPTKPGRAVVGLDLVVHAAATGTRRPWFVTGGMNSDTVGEAIAAGATRVVVVRAITEASDPAAAAAAIKAALRSSG